MAVAFCFPTAIHENSDHFPYALALDISLKKNAVNKNFSFNTDNMNSNLIKIKHGIFEGAR